MEFKVVEIFILSSIVISDCIFLINGMVKFWSLVLFLSIRLWNTVHFYIFLVDEIFIFVTRSVPGNVVEHFLLLGIELFILIFANSFLALHHSWIILICKISWLIVYKFLLLFWNLCQKDFFCLEPFSPLLLDQKFSKLFFDFVLSESEAFP